jgi:hypothetical protein
VWLLLTTTVEPRKVDVSPPDIFRIFPEFWYVGERESGVEKDADAAFEE